MRNCGCNPCGQQILAADQNGVLYPTVDGKQVIPNYGDHPQYHIKTPDGSPLKINKDPDDPYCFIIEWAATFNEETRELISADGSTVLFTVPVEDHRLSVNTVDGCLALT